MTVTHMEKWLLLGIEVLQMVIEALRKSRGLCAHVRYVRALILPKDNGHGSLVTSSQFFV